ncbi:MAG: hypothetical protein KIT79_15105 [Deltaproteobacteria bacterium]|nr:hypothetical protein [Deltaproteobacteria bacterium]
MSFWSKWILPWKRRRGRVLEVKFGYNPNSSSIGADLTPLVIFSGFLMVAIPVISAYLRSRVKPGHGEPMPGQSGTEAAS